MNLAEAGRMIATEAICITVDVEWAHPAVLDDLHRMIDERGLRATFFCTHGGIDLPGHERALHPNFRGDGDCLKALVARDGPDALRDQAAAYRFVMAWFGAFAPEAQGVRGHSLHYDSQLLDIYRAHGIVYDSSYQLPLAAGLRPFWKEAGILELPMPYRCRMGGESKVAGSLKGTMRAGWRIVTTFARVAVS